MPVLTASIVGAQFRPPAKAIMAALPAQCALTLVREPQNPYDANAVAVFVRSADIPEGSHAVLAEEALGYGSDLETILQAPAWQLGYCDSKKSGMAGIVSPLILRHFPDGECPAKLGFSTEGWPQLVVEFPE